MPGSDTIWMVLTTGDNPDVLSEGPDIEAVVAATLRGSAISDLDDRAYSKIPADPIYPLATVQRIGGIWSVRPYLDAGNVQVDIWARTKQEAHDIAVAARASLMALEGQAILLPSAMFITGVEDSLGLTWIPDAETGLDRYLFSLIFHHHSL